MTQDEADLLRKARDSLSAAELLLEKGYSDFAASRAYYCMFYVAQLFLEHQGLSFSKHSAVIAGLGQHIAKTGIVPTEYHRLLIKAQELRQTSDYGHPDSVSSEEAREVIESAKSLVEFGERCFEEEVS